MAPDPLPPVGAETPADALDAALCAMLPENAPSYFIGDEHFVWASGYNTAVEKIAPLLTTERETHRQEVARLTQERDAVVRLHDHACLDLVAQDAEIARLRAENSALRATATVVTFGDGDAQIARLLAEIARLREALEDDTLLSLDMIDVDRLEKWAENIETYGSDLTQWADPRFLVVAMRGLAKNIEATVRAVGKARAALAPASTPEEG